MKVLGIPETYTVDEVAEALRINRMTAYRAVWRGEIPHFKIGRRTLIPRAALEAMFQKAS